MEITIENVIKIILGILVFGVVIFGVYILFKNYIIDFFKNVLGGESPKIFLYLLK